MKKTEWVLWSVCALIALSAVLAVYLIFHPPLDRKSVDERVRMTDEYQKKMDDLSAEMGQLAVTQDMAEDMHDPKKYLESVEAAARKSLQADELYEEWRAKEGSERSRKGLSDGLQHGMGEVWRRPFNREEKFRMLAERYSLSLETVKLLKSEVELMFAEELVEKFSPPPQDSGDNGADRDDRISTDGSASGPKGANH